VQKRHAGRAAPGARRSRRLEVAGVVRAGVRGALLCSKCSPRRRGFCQARPRACLDFADLPAKPAASAFDWRPSAVARILPANESAMATKHIASRAVFFTRVQTRRTWSAVCSSSSLGARHCLSGLQHASRQSGADSSTDMQDDETKDAKLICNRPGTGFRAACLGIFHIGGFHDISKRSVEYVWFRMFSHLSYPNASLMTFVSLIQ
jgi:hypothetical protein